MIDINNLTNIPINKKIFFTVAKKLLKEENKERNTFSLAFIDKEEIKRLNRKYRKKNKPTDVLAFAENLTSKRKFVIPDFGLNYLGEIVICPEIVKENAQKYNTAFKKEMLKVFIHGILHLLGYDHKKKKDAQKMETKEKYYLSFLI